jgi:hypothetical protein
MANYTDNEIDEKLVLRAISAHYRYGGIDQPSSDSTVQTVENKQYVVLVNANGILAVYRVRNDGKLKGLKRYPKEIV